MNPPLKSALSSMLALATALALTVAAAPGLAADAAAVAEVAAIHAVDQTFVKAYNANDLETVVAQYAERAVLSPPGVPWAEGKPAIRAFFKDDMAASFKEGFKFALDPGADGGVSGDLGWSSGTFAVKDKAGNIVEKGKYLSVSRKIDGKWLYVRDTWNFDDSPAPPPPAAPRK